MSTEQKLIENLTAQLEIKDRLLLILEDDVKNLTESLKRKSNVRAANEEIIRIQDEMIEVYRDALNSKSK